MDKFQSSENSSEKPILQSFREYVEHQAKSRNNTSDLVELIEDYYLLNRAITYWTGKSIDMVVELTGLINEIEQEMLEITSDVDLSGD